VAKPPGKWDLQLLSLCIAQGLSSRQKDEVS
jgi:hypothetical protein